ncbi:hypothetical protein SAMN05444487_10789 [Marininema mesophilum]|uniref:Uncharacterized protein n=1 Tax=Marininema mesophilum TaxID=1048340 RepID=A0A1H2X5L6_9BACL|nr:hypothetical protein [Marininema mesophilum]SDW88046.1 hypothetical protein SAMN05444487_10789 [Marininema mesophilum]
MVLRVFRGICLGIFLCLTTGLVSAFFGLKSGVLLIVLMQVITYVPAGYLVSKHENHRFLLTGITGICLVILNMLITFGIYGPMLAIDIFSLLAGLVYGVLLCIVGAGLSVMVEKIQDR